MAMILVWAWGAKLAAQPRLWHVANLEARHRFSVLADTVYAIDTSLFIAVLRGESILFRGDPFHPISRSFSTTWLPAAPGVVLQKRNRLLFPTDSKTLRSNPAFVFDSVLIWNNALLGRYRRNKAWIWKPGQPDELQADSILFQEGRLLLFQFRGILLVDSALQTQFIPNIGIRRQFSKGFQFVLTDSIWYPTNPVLNPMVQKKNAVWWNDTSLVDSAAGGFFLQSARIQRVRIADSGSTLTPHFLLLKTKKAWWLRLASGKRVSISKPLKISIVNDSIVAIKQLKGWILVSGNGLKAEVNKSVSEIQNFSEGLILVKAGKRFGFIDVHGFIRISCRYDSLWLFDNGVAAARLGNAWGYLDKNEKLVVQPHYTRPGRFTNGLAPVCGNSKWGLMKKTGELQQPCIFDSLRAGQYSGWICSRNGWKGWADISGKLILQTKYFHTIEASKEIIQVIREDKTGLFLPNGNLLLPIDYQRITLDTQNRCLMYY